MVRRLPVPDAVRLVIDRTAPDLEESIRFALAREICRAIQGRMVPYDAVVETRRQRSARDVRIRALYDGTNAVALAERFGLSKRHINRIVASHGDGRGLKTRGD